MADSDSSSESTSGTTKINQSAQKQLLGEDLIDPLNDIYNHVFNTYCCNAFYRSAVTALLSCNNEENKLNKNELNGLVLLDFWLGEQEREGMKLIEDLKS